MRMTASDRLATAVAGVMGERTYRDTAEEIGISPASLHRVTSGHEPSFDTLIQIATWLDCDMNPILTGESDLPGPTSLTSVSSRDMLTELARREEKP